MFFSACEHTVCAFVWVLVNLCVCLHDVCELVVLMFSTALRVLLFKEHKCVCVCGCLCVCLGGWVSHPIMESLLESNLPISVFWFLPLPLSPKWW